MKGLYCGNFYYFNISLIFLIIINFIRKIRKFYERKFFSFDELLSQYLYEESQDKKDELLININRRQVIEYIVNDFTREIIIRMNAEVELNRRKSGRIFFIFLFMFFPWFFYQNTYFFVPVLNMNLNLLLIANFFFRLVSAIMENKKANPTVENAMIVEFIQTAASSSG